MKSYDAEIPEYVDCTRMAQLMRSVAAVCTS